MNLNANTPSNPESRMSPFSFAGRFTPLPNGESASSWLASLIALAVGLTALAVIPIRENMMERGCSAADCPPAAEASRPGAVHYGLYDPYLPYPAQGLTSATE